MINLPKPDTHSFDIDTQRDVWSYSPELVHNIVEQQNLNLLALVEKKNEALQSVVNLQKYLEGPTVSQDHAQAKADAHEETMSSVQEALTLSADDVELVEVNHVDYVEVDPAHYDVVSTLDDGEKLYKIQMKGK